MTPCPRCGSADPQHALIDCEQRPYRVVGLCGNDPTWPSAPPAPTPHVHTCRCDECQALNASEMESQR